MSTALHMVSDEQQKVRTIIALGLAALAEAAASYGIKSSNDVLKVVNELKDEAEPYREMVMETSSCIYKESMTS